jgi:hypothetical protein
LICCATAAGDAHSSLVSSDLSVTRIFKHGVREGIDVSVEISPSPYVSQALFEKHVSAVLIPTVESNRRLPGFEKMLV